MLIVKKYHTEAVKEWEQIKQEEEKRRAGLTEKERIAEREQRHREADAIIQRVEETDKNTFRMISQERIKQFLQVSTNAVHIEVHVLTEFYRLKKLMNGKHLPRWLPSGLLSISSKLESDHLGFSIVPMPSPLLPHCWSIPQTAPREKQGCRCSLRGQCDLS